MTPPRITYQMQFEGPHAKLTIWLDGANIGMLTVPVERIDVLDRLVLALRDAHNAAAL